MAIFAPLSRAAFLLSGQHAFPLTQRCALLVSWKPDGELLLAGVFGCFRTFTSSLAAPRIENSFEETESPVASSTAGSSQGQYLAARTDLLPTSTTSHSLHAKKGPETFPLNLNPFLQSTSRAFTTALNPKPSQYSEAEQELLAATAPSKTKSDGTIGVRFYKQVGVQDLESGYRVLLDGRPLRSPAKRPLILPSKELALAIAAEWEWQDVRNIRPFTMPLMKLASTATDLVPLQRPAIVDNLMKYFKSSDAVCVRQPGGGALARKQGETWDPILEWMEKEIGVRPVTSDSIFGAVQPEAVVKRVQEVLHQKSDFRLAAVDALASSAHSLVIALAVSRGHLGLQKALEAVRLEEDHQIEEWGLVEGGHDLDIADTRVRIAAPSLFLRVLND